MLLHLGREPCLQPEYLHEFSPLKIVPTLYKERDNQAILLSAPVKSCIKILDFTVQSPILL